MGDFDTTATAGMEWRGYRRGTTSTDSWDQYVVPVYPRYGSFAGRAMVFWTPGRGATAQKLITLHNAAGSDVIVSVNRLGVDILTLAPKLVTTLPPALRVYRFTAVPTGGDVLAKAPIDSGGSSSASVVVRGDASADGTGSSTALACTVAASGLLDQAWGPRSLAADVLPASAVQFEVLDAIIFFRGEPDVTLRAGEGICLALDFTTTAGNITTDRWLAGLDWTEYQEL